MFIAAVRFRIRFQIEVLAAVVKQVYNIRRSHAEKIENHLAWSEIEKRRPKSAKISVMMVG